MTYAFTFDASACSGCKACQVACKDKNQLPVGVLWRRVYEISGGTWYSVGAELSRPNGEPVIGAREPRSYGPNAVWETDVFAYNLSIACNHCVHPKCAGVCPTDAYVVREDGIVYIDTSKCIGCGYCSWACHYAAPQYNREAGLMTKCNFCYDHLDAGLPPACVAACPMRVLDFVEIREQRAEISDRKLVSGKIKLWEIPGTEHPFPLPNYSRTEPHLAIQPHTAMANTLEKTVSNREEIRPGKAKSELPLVAFTLLGQMAAGMALFSFSSGPLTTPFLIVMGALIGASGLASLLHLGRPMNAWRALTHLKKSWLSREILMFVLFGASWLLSLAMPGMGKLPLTICGIGLVYSMAQVYRLRSVPAWDTNRTLLAFIGSAITLGILGWEGVDLFADTVDIYPQLYLVVAVGLVVALLQSLTDLDQDHQTARRLRLGLIGLGLAGVLAMYVIPNTVGRWIMVPIFLVVLVEEVLGRWQFYERPLQRVL